MLIYCRTEAEDGMISIQILTERSTIEDFGNGTVSLLFNIEEVRALLAIHSADLNFICRVIFIKVQENSILPYLHSSLAVLARFNQNTNLLMP